MVLDIELTLNRFGFYKPDLNKLQIGFIRFSVWHLPKWAVSFEINWRNKEVSRYGKVESEKQHDIR